MSRAMSTDMEKAQSIIPRLYEMIGDDAVFCIAVENQIFEDCGEAVQRVGIRMDLPQGAELPGKGNAAVVFLDEKPVDCSVQEFADYAAGQFQAWREGRRPGGIPEDVLTQMQLTRPTVLQNVVLRAVDRERYAEELKIVAHCDFLDLAGEYWLYEEGKEIGLMLHNYMKDGLGITDEELLYAARWNTLSRLGIVMGEFTSYSKSMKETGKWNPPPVSEVKIEKSTFYMVSNRIGRFGTSLLLIPEVLDTLGEKAGMDYYVLPIGIDQFVIHTDDDSVTRNDLLWRVQVTYRLMGDPDPEKVLTDTLYHYSRKDRQLSIA